jgi:hypothetical protein
LDSFFDSSIMSERRDFFSSLFWFSGFILWK